MWRRIRTWLNRVKGGAVEPNAKAITGAILVMIAGGGATTIFTNLLPWIIVFVIGLCILILQIYYGNKWQAQPRAERRSEAPPAARMATIARDKTSSNEDIEPYIISQFQDLAPEIRWYRQRITLFDPIIQLTQPVDFSKVTIRTRELYKRLSELGIKCPNYRHPPWGAFSSSYTTMLKMGTFTKRVLCLTILPLIVKARDRFYRERACSTDCQTT